MDCSLSLKECKKAMRAEYIELRNGIDENVRTVQDKQIREVILDLPIYKNSTCILAYVSFGSEVDTISLIKDALGAGKRVAVPRCEPRTSTMDFLEINSLVDLVPGYMGILEPDSTLDTVVEPDTKTLCLVPGCAFDEQCNRLGYGRGFYDRYLADFCGSTVGLAYTCQIGDELLPIEQYDKKLDCIVTPSGIIKNF